jgi:hypothetical protein
MSIWCSFHVFGLLCQEKSGSPDGIESVHGISTPISECNSIFFSKGAFPKKGSTQANNVYDLFVPEACRKKITSEWHVFKAQKNVGVYLKRPDLAIPT